VPDKGEGRLEIIFDHENDPDEQTDNDASQGIKGQNRKYSDDKGDELAVTAQIDIYVKRGTCQFVSSNNQDGGETR
jgi:hypothetical protein